VVDDTGAEVDFPIERLQEWKREREHGQYEQLQGLREVTEDRLVRLIAQAQDERDQEMTAVLGRLETSDREAAGLMRELLDELSVANRRSALDLGAVEMLDSASRRLRGLEDSAYRLRAAAKLLADMEHLPSSIKSAAKDVTRAAAALEDARPRRR
jgi:hypothetical protein